MAKLPKVSSWPSLLIITIFVLGLSIRLFPGLDHMLFMYDQARDAFLSQEIIRGSFKITGPPTDIPTLFHGPLYYYILAVFYALGRSDPRVALLGVIILNLLTAIPIGILVHKTFNNRWVTLTAMVLFFCSFEMVSYARWLSNPALVIPAIALWLLGIRLKNLPLIAIGLGLCIQFQFFMLYLLPLTVLSYFIFKLKPAYLLRSLLILFLLLSSFLIAELKFKFQGILGLITFFTRENNVKFDFLPRLIHYGESLRELFVNNLFPPVPYIAVSLGLALIILNIYAAKKNPRFRELWYLSLFLLVGHFLVFFLSNTMHIFIGVGVGIGVILLAVNAIYFLALKSKLLASLLFLSIVAGNLYTIMTHDQSLFKVQPGMILKDQVALVNKTYEIAAGREFSINTIANPYLYPTTWAYLYRKKPPLYRGLTPYTYPGEGTFSMCDTKKDLEFLIVEPEVGAANSWANQLIDAEKRRHDLRREYKFGELTLLEF